MFVIINVSDHGGYDSEEGWVPSMAPDEDGWGPFDTREVANEAEKKLTATCPTYTYRGRTHKCDYDLRIIEIKEMT